MKKLLILLLSIFLLLPITACGSAFDSPEKYVTLPALSSITVSEKAVDEELSEVIDDLLEGLTGEHFTPLDGSEETVRAGDRVQVSFAPTEGQGLSAETVKLLTANEKDRIYLIPGSDTMPKALEDAVLGKKVGDTPTAEVTYTADDTDITELIGKTVTLKLTLHKIARLTVTNQHAVKVRFTAKLAGEEIPIDQILSLLKGDVETVDLADEEDTFNTVFSSGQLAEKLVGLHKLDTTTFSLTLPKEKATEYGYDRDITLDFEATLLSATDTPSELTDLLIDEMTYGVYTDVESYLVFCRNMVKEEMALQAIMEAAEFEDDLPEKEYDEFYTENYNAALYAVVGDVSGYTPEQLGVMLSNEVLQKVQETAHENTVRELYERFVLEYLYELLDVRLTKAEYDEKLSELFASYQAEYYYMLYYYNITTKEALEGYLGKDYIEVQFRYEKLLPLLKDEITYTE